MKKLVDRSSFGVAFLLPRMKIKKRGQQTVGLPFGMIFSIFLIVVFIVIAFIAIGYFLDFGNTAAVGTFYEDLQVAVSDAWSGQSSNFSFDINLPSDISTVCFANLSEQITGFRDEYGQIERYEVYEANVFLIPPENAEDLQYKLLDKIDLDRITVEDNPYCVDAEGEIRISKGFYDKLVMIE